MAKITAKHFLNTNLKPYLINKEKHYSIYISLVAFRKNTKVKSIVFDEYYNENTFDEIINSSEQYDINLIENEIKTITLITEIAVNVLKDFDTAFITAYFKFSSMINISSSIESDKYVKNSRVINDVETIINNLGKYSKYLSVVETIEAEYEYYNSEFISKILKNTEKSTYTIEVTFIEKLSSLFKDITIFEFFNKNNQDLLNEYANKYFKNINHQEFIFEYNKAIFLNSLQRFSKDIQKTKNSYLIEKYSKVFIDYTKL